MALQAQVTRTDGSDGPIKKHMLSRDNPLAHVTEKEWSDAGNLQSVDVFYDSVQPDTGCLLAEGGQASLFTFVESKGAPNAEENYPDGPGSDERRIVAKYYKLFDCERHSTLRSIWNEYVFVTNSKLLNYYGIYHDPEQERVMVACEPLNYTLRHYVEVEHRDRAISELECKRIIVDLLSDLWTTHKAGFIHNDLNCDNVMYRDGNGDGDVAADDKGSGWKLIDFGLLLNIEEVKGEGMRYKGTRGWTPPEINPYSKNNLYSESKDIWSLGLLILYILLKEQPYTTTAFEQQVLCKGDSTRYKEYFYFHKLLQIPFRRNKRFRPSPNNKKRSLFRKNKRRRIEEKPMNPNDFENGQKWLKKYLYGLYREEKISYELCGLLLRNMLCFDPKQRSDCNQIYQHRWFDEVRDL